MDNYQRGGQRLPQVKRVDLGLTRDDVDQGDYEDDPSSKNTGIAAMKPTSIIAQEAFFSPNLLKVVTMHLAPLDSSTSLLRMLTNPMKPAVNRNVLPASYF